MDSEDSDLDIWEVATGYVSKDWLLARNMIRSAARRIGLIDLRGDYFNELSKHRDEINEELIKWRLKDG